MKSMPAPGLRDILAHQALSAADHVQRRGWVVYVARAGYAARGAVYLLVGGLALLSAFGRGGATGDQKDALQTVLTAPGGWIILDEPELHLHGDALVPDLAGWRRERGSRSASSG